MRGCLTLVAGLILGLGLAAYFTPRPPAAPSPPASTDVRATLSDAYLSRIVARHLASISVISARHVSIASAPPSRLVVSIQVGVGPLSAPVRLGVQPYAEGGEVKVHFFSTSVAGIPVPTIITHFVEQSMDQAIAHILGSGARVVGTAVTPGGLEISAEYP
jgi:hypothetical protein